MIRFSQARGLAAVVPRTIAWTPLVAVIALGGLVLWASRHAPDPPPDGGLAVVGVLLATWWSSLLGDRSAPIADAGAPTLLLRRTIRIAVGLPLVGALWGAALAWAAPGPYAGTLTFVFGSQLALALGIAALALHTIDAGKEPLVAAAGLFTVFVGVPFVFEVDLSPIPPTDTWWLHAGRWLSLTAVGMVAFVAGSRDPAARPIASALRRSAFDPAPTPIVR